MYYVWLLASRPYGTLYVGVTSDLAHRIAEHKNKLVPGSQYDVDRLVWFEAHDSAAIQREKRIKEWKRDWKINLIGMGNGLRRCDNRG
jgi:putative endonuclease